MIVAVFPLPENPPPPPLPPEMNGGENCPVEIPPTTLPRPRLNRLMPMLFALLRSTLANFTFNRISGFAAGVSTLSRFTTLPAVEAIWTARETLVMSFTVPRR